MKKFFIPKYALFPSIVMVAVSEFAYMGTKLITDTGTRHYDISLGIDHIIPFIPAFITIYVLSYLQWVIGYGMVVYESKDICYKVFSGVIAAKLISTVIFLAMPTIMHRPEVLPDDIFGKLTSFIYSCDTPTNLFPSFHCLESWVLFKSAFMLKKQGKWVRYAWFVFALAVFASILFVRQHLVLDILGGIAVVEIGFFISKKLRLERLFYKADEVFQKRKKSN